MPLAYSDSENDSQSEGNNSSAHDSDNEDLNFGGAQDCIKPKEQFYEDIYGDRTLSVAEFNRSLLGKSFDELKVPPSSKQPCPPETQAKIDSLLEDVRSGKNMVASIQKNKKFRNPSIYENLIAFCSIDEKGTNCPKEIYDPSKFLTETSYYDSLAQRQQQEMDRLERERKEIGKTEASKRMAIPVVSGGHKREKQSKWDVGAASSSSSSSTITGKSAKVAEAISRVQHIVQANAANKPKVIAAFGTISKKK